MIIGVPKEIKLQEHRIGLTPDSVKVLSEKGHKVLVETNGGLEAGFTNQDYEKSGAIIYDSSKKILFLICTLETLSLPLHVISIRFEISDFSL